MRRFYVLPTILGLLAVLAVGFWGYREQQARRGMEAYVNNSYQRAFYNLADHVQNVQVLLGKSLMAPEKKYDGEIYNDIWRHAAAAQENLGQLPVNQEVVGRTAKFLTQVGDFAHTLAVQSGNGVPVTREKWLTLSKLYNQSASLNAQLQKAQGDILDGRVTVRELAAETTGRLRGESKKLANNNFQTINEKMQEYPSLIYDGPFSDHLERRTPRGVTGADISAAEAKAKALHYIDQKQYANPTVRVIGRTKGKILSYRVEVNSARDQANKTTMDISQKGGYLVWLINTRSVGSSKISVNDALARARSFLAARGYKDMAETYYIQQDGTVTFNFAYMNKSVIVYTDLIKVTVALDRGDVVAMDASGYLMSHHIRNIGPPKVIMADAKKAINTNVKIERGRLAVIPLDNGSEKLTYEFSGSVNDQRYLVYVDTNTGKQVKVLQVIKTPSGALTM